MTQPTAADPRQVALVEGLDLCGWTMDGNNWTINAVLTVHEYTHPSFPQRMITVPIDASQEQYVYALDRAERDFAPFRAILAAGAKRATASARTPLTVDDLDALPTGSVVVDVNGGPSANCARKDRGGLWEYTGSSSGWTSADLATNGPILLLFLPADASSAPADPLDTPAQTDQFSRTSIPLTPEQSDEFWNRIASHQQGYFTGGFAPSHMTLRPPTFAPFDQDTSKPTPPESTASPRTGGFINVDPQDLDQTVANPGLDADAQA